MGPLLGQLACSLCTHRRLITDFGMQPHVSQSLTLRSSEGYDRVKTDVAV